MILVIGIYQHQIPVAENEVIEYLVAESLVEDSQKNHRKIYEDTASKE